jgi:two-component system alkaline phosphatase synthesis response regulator PhoP
MKILVADDSATIRRLVTARLEADGYQVVEAEDGQQAIELARAEHPDAYILDKIMPRKDGFEVVQALRGDPQTAFAPIVMLTDRSGEADVLGGLDLGVDEYMPKPFSPHELSARLRRALARAGLL